LTPFPPLTEQSLGQEAGESSEPSNRKGQIDLLVRQSIELGRLAALSAALPGGEESKRDQPLEVLVGDGSVDAHCLGDVIDRPFKPVR
jgi:hypothetical protein